MARKASLKFNKKAWDALVKEVVETEGVERMQRVADACNNHIETDGYKVSVEGDDPLDKRDYRATVITSDVEAILDNQRNNTLVSEFHQAGG
ncbi:hypothetical protein PXH78_26950 [Mycolicibacterium smegmatis]|uniref:hypothetical protein n=1 Tax=Mycolicibacterium smegmatis TaxID=1772 RepID=UPI0005D83E63|nr:hypothetical protein [Mycolicibacterium smegmatis]MDF1902751.1 hypothetical protein [Mycolicibacterium smegmatis]MDF1909027.1 hypothetical protein [Mycolicibacterium smegmatis]MDF1921246.1 hypothetical protein [Mycolicibacterium smegmatis]MDF1927511.1 hypothetical protein [Mycolicibacterium smegmatis]UAK53368.1 hypothetical protein K8P01_22510 [Mycolicibacterium smegmatis]